jgi:clan AA aspartic protease (TIGR02281 family)
MITHARTVLLATALAFGAASAAPAAPPPASLASISVPMKKDGGVYVVPVSANGIATFDCIVDSGATDVNIPSDVFRKLQRAGTVKDSDYLGTQDYTLADGSNQTGRTYRIRSLKVGNVVVNNVVASVGGGGDSALLGQSFLERFGSWSVDNRTHALILIGAPSPGPHVTTVASGSPATGRHPKGPPDPTSVAQTGAHDDPDGPAEAADDHLTAQRSRQ